MKSKAPLALIELVIMLLIFSLAAALCLQAFSMADRISRQSEVRDNAALQAQNAAEILKHCGGDFALAAASYGGSWDGTHWQIHYDADWKITASPDTYTLTAAPEDTENALLGRTHLILRSTADHAEIFRLSAAWQKEGKA